MKTQSADKSKPTSKLSKQKTITFQFDKARLQCFISKPRPKPQPNKLVKEEQSKIVKHPTFQRGKASSFVSANYHTFNNQVLLLQYGKHDVYIDSTKLDGQNKSKTPSPKHQEIEQDAYDFSCVRNITEDTEHTSNQISARVTTENTSQSSSIYPLAYNQYYYPARNKRAISFEESRAYVIEVQSIIGDGRCTVMVRNIPNKYTQQMLLKLFLQNHRNKFDFFYLPIDFNNNCNVGYAFINFIHVKFIKDFYLEFNDKKWQKFNSQKICNICYARIQGKAQLSFHFERSKVIQQRDKRGRPLGLLQNFHSDLQQLIQKQKRNQK